jgi:Tannase and feruloyl esterase
MAQGLAQGYAAVGGDTGHQTPTPDDLLWGVGHPDRIIDWGSRSIHATSVSAKSIASVLGGEPPRRAYFYGCSTGGHQGYAEIQRYPQDFDGVIAGAPGNNRVRLTAGVPVAVSRQSPSRRRRESRCPRVETAGDHQGGRRILRRERWREGRGRRRSSVLRLRSHHVGVQAGRGT